MGAIPGISRVNFHNPFLAYENGEDFKSSSIERLKGRSKLLSIPNEDNKDEGYWAAFGPNRETGQPITTWEWIDRLAPKAWAVVAAGTCAPMAEFTLATTTN